MLVALSGLVIRRIGIDRSGPLMTVVVPWDILQRSPRAVIDMVMSAGTVTCQRLWQASSVFPPAPAGR
jgi:hypothetical protein